MVTSAPNAHNEAEEQGRKPHNHPPKTNALSHSS